MVERGRVFHPLPIFDCGGTRVELAGWDIARNAALRREHGAVTDRQMTGKARLPAQHAALAHPRRAR